MDDTIKTEKPQASGFSAEKAEKKPACKGACAGGHYSIREIREEEYYLLANFLYEAIYIPEGVPAPPKSILAQPELQVYLTDFGRMAADVALVAEVDGKVVGAVWVRIMNDYGHIDDSTPSFAISLYKAYRSLGIGTALMQEMLALLRRRGFRRASLSVQKANAAARLYQRLGFVIVEEDAEEYIMVCELG